MVNKELTDIDSFNEIRNTNEWYVVSDIWVKKYKLWIDYKTREYYPDMIDNTMLFDYFNDYDNCEIKKTLKQKNDYRIFNKNMFL